MSRFSRAPAFLLAGLLASLPCALRAETECTALFDRLDQVEQEADQMGQPLQDDDALSNARTMFDHLGCGNIPNDPTCQNLSTQIKSMQAPGTGNDLARERKRLMSQLRAAGCLNNEGRGSWDDSTKGAKNPEVFDDLYKEGGQEDIWRSPPSSGKYNDDGTDMAPAMGNGHYRTLCVRACDGFYWPISFSAKPGNFVRDQEMCAASCPSQQVSLYVHRNPGEWSEQAKSLQGDSYAALANAFLYRKRYVKDCSCEAQLQQVEIINGPQNPGEERAFSPIAKPEEPLEERLKPHQPAQPEDADVYRSVPIITPQPGGKKDTGINGLRGVSP